MIKSIIILSLLVFSTSNCTVADDNNGYEVVKATPVQYENQYKSHENPLVRLLFDDQPPSRPDTTLQIADYVRRIFQDKNGNLWFGTNGYGVCRYNGKALKYFSINEGLGGTQITGIVEDKEGNLWFSTNGGVSMYDGKTFTTYTEDDGLSDNGVWSILYDSKGTIWAGTKKGLSRFNGKAFIPFALPLAEVENAKPRFSTSCVRSIMEDKKGNLWFGMDGVGICIYDGNTFKHITTEDGLCDNNISSVLEDKNGNFWISTMWGGVSMYDPSASLAAGGKTFTNFTKKGLVDGVEVWNIYEDSIGDIWFTAEGYGVYRYDGSSQHTEQADFTNFSKKEGLNVLAPQDHIRDKEGRFWVGGGGGLYRFDGVSRFYNVTKNGPWN